MFFEWFYFGFGTKVYNVVREVREGEGWEVDFGIEDSK